MKKVLSIILAFTFAVQPAYSVVQPAQPAKKGIITKAKEKWSAMKEAIKRGNDVLKANWQCITTGKGEKCSPDRYLALQVIRNFVTGKTEAAREAFQKLVQAHKDCWVPILAMLVTMGFITAGSLEYLVTGQAIGTGVSLVVVGAAAPLTQFVVLSIVDPEGTKAFEGLMRAFSRERIKKCLLVIGIDLPIIIAIVWILNRMAYKYSLSPEHIDDMHARGTLLLNAVRAGDVDRVRELLEHKANPNIAGGDGYTPLMWAAQSNYVDIVRLLVEHSADPNKQDERGYTPLMWAANKDHKGMVALLLEHKADPNKQDKHGYTPLKWAADEGHKDMVALLLEHKADPNIAGGDGKTPLMWAAYKDHKGMVALLLEHKADPNKQDKDGWTPLLEAASMGYVGVVELLLEKGADPNQQDKHGFTPLRKAAFKGDVNIANLLIRKGADLHVRDHDGNTPLHIAAFKGLKEMANILIAAGADANLPNNAGQKPEQLTTDPEFQKMLKPKLEWKTK